MNGVHDMGGMQDMGPVQYERDEPVFHERWEARIFALTLAAGPPKWNIDANRHKLELMDPVEYLRMSYYERWLARLPEVLIRAGVLTSAEVESGSLAPGSPKAIPRLTASEVPALIAHGNPKNRDLSVASHFQAGQRVRARNINPVGHTRLPRYVRAKIGTVARDHGVFVFPDTNAHFLGENPQHLYSVRFAARELWGKQAAPHDSVYLDLWNHYLEPA